LRDAIRERLNPKQATVKGEKAQVEYIVREDAKHPMMKLWEEIERKNKLREK
jgi:hypothetical protein